MKSKESKNIFLKLFLFIISFIKHFFIGVKFIFFDSFIEIYSYFKNKKSFKEIANTSKSSIPNNIKMIVPKEYYIYTGIDSNGKKVKSSMSATNKMTLNNFLVNEGITVTSIKKDSTKNFLKKIGLDSEREMKTKDLIFWLTQVSTYLKAGLTINDTFKIMATQAKRDKIKSDLYRSILYELTLGESFSIALERQGKVFPSLLVNMIKSGEATGDIVSTLEDMAEYYTEMDKTRKEMISAIIYPIILLIFAIAVLTFIMVYVIPEFIKVYDQAGITVSGFTLSIIHISNYITSNINMIILIALLVILVLLYLYKKSTGFRKLIQTIGMKIPFFGNIIIYHELTLFTKTFASLLKNSVYITSSMEILSNITNNEVYKSIMIETMENIANGEKISLSFYHKWCIPDVAYYMIVTGETTGELSMMMEKVANYYNGLHKSKVTNLKSFLEPIMIVILAIIVGVIILAVVIPMFSLYGQIG